MAYAFVQQVEADNSGTSQSSVATGSFGSSLTAGNTLVCCVVVYGTNSVDITLSGAGSPTWVAETVIGAAGTTLLYCFYALNIPGGTTTGVTATLDGLGDNPDYPAIYVAEYSGFKTSGARLAFVGQRQTAPGTGTDAVSSGLLGTLSEQPAGIVAFTVNEAADTTPAAGTSFTSLTAAWDYGSTLSARPEHLRVTATTSVAGTFTAGSNQPHMTAAWAFSEAAGGGGTANPWYYFAQQ